MKTKTILRTLCFALLSINFYSCEPEEEDIIDVNDPNAEPKYSVSGTWSQAGEVTGDNQYSYRSDHWKFSVSSTSDFRIILTSQIDLHAFILNENGSRIYSRSGRNEIDKTIPNLDVGNYKIVVATHGRRKTGTIDYDLGIYGDVTKPNLVAARTESMVNVALPVDTINPSRASAIYYEVRLGNDNELDAIDIHVTSSREMQITVFQSGRWSSYSWADGREASLTWQELSPDNSYYFKIEPEYYNSTPPGTTFDLSVNARNFVLIPHGANDPT